MLLVDRVEELEEGKRVVAKKTLLSMSHFSKVIFPEPVMPGVLIVEAMAQAAVALLSLERGKTAYFGGLDKAKFRKSNTRRYLDLRSRNNQSEISAGIGKELPMLMEKSGGSRIDFHDWIGETCFLKY